MAWVTAFVPTKSRWRNSSLGTRLACLYVGLLAVLLAALGTFVHFETREFLISATASGLRAQAKPVIERWLHTAGATPDLAHIAADLSRDLTSRNTTALVFDRQGALLAHGRHLPEEPMPARAPAAQVAQALAGDNEVSYLLGTVAPETLALLIPLRPAPGHPSVLGVAQLNTPLREVEDDLLRQRVALTAGVLIAIALGGVGGITLTSAALRPLRRVIGACRRVAAGDLGQRIEPTRYRDEVGELAEAFNDMAARLQASFSTQHRFVADAAHELRTPLTGMKASLEVMMRGIEQEPGVAQQLAAGVYNEASRLTRLAEQLLDLSRMSNPLSLQLRPVDLQPFMAQFLPQAQRLSRGHAIRLEPGTGAHVSADPEMLTQALMNLIDNAVQHSEHDGEIRIGWEVSERHAQIWVADDGEGIAAADLPHVLEPFYRGDRSRSRRRGGAGIGLSLVQSIVEAHGGQIRISSVPGRGAMCRVTIPIIES